MIPTGLTLSLGARAVRTLALLRSRSGAFPGRDESTAFLVPEPTGEAARRLHVRDKRKLTNRLREHWMANRNRIGRERGWGPAGEREFVEEIEEGALYVGSPDTVAAKIPHAVRTLGVDRFDLEYANGPMPHAQLMRSIVGDVRVAVPACPVCLI